MTDFTLRAWRHPRTVSITAPALRGFTASPSRSSQHHASLPVRSYASDGRWWAPELAPNWAVVPPAAAPQRAPLQHDDCIAVVPPARDAALRVFAYDHATQSVTAQQWVEACTQFSARRGAPPEPWASGVFSGAHARRSDAGVWWRTWWLAAGTIGLNALYRCPLAIAGRDDADLDDMLRRLQFGARAG